MGQQDAAIDALNQAAELATAINYDSFQQYAQDKIAHIQSSHLSTGEAG